jgi:rhomboid protease GluP
MDFNSFIAWLVIFSCFIITIRIIKVSGLKTNLGWLFICQIIVFITVISRYLFPQISGLISLILWFTLIIIPLLGFSKINQLVEQENYQKARQLAEYLRYLHPADGWLEQPEFLLSLELGQQGKIEEAKAIIERYPAKNTMGRQAKALLYLMEADWFGFLTWIDQEIPEKVLFNDGNLLIFYLRALGEVGELNSLIQNLTKGEILLAKLGDNIRLNLIRMFAMAFCGKTEQVWQLFDYSLANYSQNTRIFWLATAQMARGNIEAGRDELLQLKTKVQGFQEKGIDWRLANPPANAKLILTPYSESIIAQIETNIQEERRYKNLSLSMSQKSPVTTFLIGLNLLAFGLEMAFGGVENIETLYFLGALVPGDVIAGQWWRLLTANFLHFGWLHLLTNMLGLYWLGSLVELTLGKVRYLIAYFLSGIGAMIVYTYIAIHQGQPDQLLIGASAAIMGLIGVIGAFFFRGWRQEKSRLAAKRLQSILVIVLIQSLFDLTIPQVSGLSHILGVIIGFIVGNFLLIFKD